VFNEAISNVFKHAYKVDESGTCYISMKRSEDNRVVARVRDEGVGIPESVDVDKAETLGLKLLRNLVLHQLNGKFRIEQNGGTDLFFEFDIIHDDELIHGRH
jgi:two-component sensor histidine kinase